MALSRYQPSLCLKDRLAGHGHEFRSAVGKHGFSDLSYGKSTFSTPMGRVGFMGIQSPTVKRRKARGGRCLKVLFILIFMFSTLAAVLSLSFRKSSSAALLEPYTPALPPAKITTPNLKGSVVRREAGDASKDALPAHSIYNLHAPLSGGSDFDLGTLSGKVVVRSSINRARCFIEEPQVSLVVNVASH